MEKPLHTFKSFLSTDDDLPCENIFVRTGELPMDGFIPLGQKTPLSLSSEKVVAERTDGIPGQNSADTPENRQIPTRTDHPEDLHNAACQFPVHAAIREKLDMFYETRKIPHIIFHGASGTGKLTIVQQFIHKIYRGDKQHIKQNVMMVNCSHGKGIKFIREELKFFAKTNIQSSSGVLFKTIVLRNAHHLTIDAQSALRRCIELFSYNTRFFMLLENKHKLLKPILSRFCEIYVPENTISNERIINLHKHTLHVKYNGSSLQNKPIREYIHSQLFHIVNKMYNNPDAETSPVSILALAELAEDFYYRGISTLDVVEWLNTPEIKAYLTDIQHANSMLCFYQIKSEFRCEKMLMFYILHFVFCSTLELPPT
jgi:hypothetical protein